MTNKIQTLVNQLSLMMQVDSDVVKACKNMDFTPEMTEVFLKFHGTQMDFQKAVVEMQKVQFEMAKIIDRLTNNSNAFMAAIEAVGAHSGLSPEQIFAPESDEEEKRN